ncbi:MAG TPA: Wzz/FepE/Etk N-terminal domain-containing protein [Pseudolabrys sp.]|nr:Wzz/FepE/Etk N-terminal domain-containing protein [Pseudolabrys sp.]
MSIAQVLMIAWARKWTFVTFVIVTLLAALAAQHFLPRRYDATAQIYFRMGERDPATDAELPNSVQRSFLHTQMEMIKSRPVALKVVEMMGYDKDPAYREKFLASSEGTGNLSEWIAVKLLHNLVIDRVGLSDIISVTYKDHDGKVAAAIANAFVTASIKENIDLRSTPALDLLQWYDERLAAFREKQVEVNERRFALRQKAGIIDTGTDSLTSDPATKLASEVTTAKLEVVQAKSALYSLKNSVADGAETDEVKQLRKQITDLDSEIARTTRQLGPEHRRVRVLMANRGDLQTQLASANKRGSNEAVATAQQRVDAAERRLQALSAALSQHDEQTSKQAGSISTLTALDREADSLKSQIATMIERRERLRLQGTVDQTLASRLTLATEPLEPAFPRKILVFGLALGLGIPFGLSFAFLREMLDRRVRLPQDIATYMELPLIAVVPIPRGRSLRNRRRNRITLPSPPPRPLDPQRVPPAVRY